MTDNEKITEKIDEVIKLLDYSDGGLLHHVNELKKSDGERAKFNSELFKKAMSAVDVLFYPHLGEKEVPKKLIPIVFYLATFANYPLVFSKEFKAAQKKVDTYLKTFTNAYYFDSQDELISKLLTD